MRPSDGRFSLWPYGIVAFIVVLAVASITPVTRLNDQPPSDFLWLRCSAGKPNAPLARQYWATACSVIQWRYRAADPLPADSPVEFQPANADQSISQAGDQGARRAYWGKLREEWLKPDNWHTSYTIDALWMWRDLVSVWNDVVGYIK